jgi:hypothetical protein
MGNELADRTEARAARAPATLQNKFRRAFGVLVTQDAPIDANAPPFAQALGDPGVTRKGMLEVEPEARVEARVVLDELHGDLGIQAFCCPLDGLLRRSDALLALRVPGDEPLHDPLEDGAPIELTEVHRPEAQERQARARAEAVLQDVATDLFRLVVPIAVELDHERRELLVRILGVDSEVEVAPRVQAHRFAVELVLVAFQHRVDGQLRDDRPAGARERSAQQPIRDRLGARVQRPPAHLREMMPLGRSPR